MRAKQRKLLGILGALAVPIALVVGLYTDSGDLFKGYLTFEQNPESVNLEDDTTARGYLAKVINGDFDSDEDKVNEGVFFDVNLSSGADQDLIKPLQRVLKKQFRSIMIYNYE